MKKLFFIAAIAGAALVSCTKNELAPSATEQHEITFASPVTSALTKSSVTLVKNNYPTTSSFAVFADYHTAEYKESGNVETSFSSYMRGNSDQTRSGEGVKVSYVKADLTVGTETYDEYWKSATKYYWPMEGYLTFAAYSPYEITGYNKNNFNYSFANGVKITDYTVSMNNQYDLMLSDRAINQERSSMDENWDPTPNDNNTTNATPYDGVNINFRHALAAIRFVVKTDNDYSTDGYTITLNSLTVNAKSVGDLTQFTSIDSRTADIAWTNQDTPADYTVQSTNVGLSTTAALLGTDANNANLVLMPQVLSDEASKVTVTIVYNVKHADYPSDGITYTKPIEIATSTVDKWVAGKRYLYTITIGMEEIVFAPTVTDWVDEPNKDITL